MVPLPPLRFFVPQAGETSPGWFHLISLCPSPLRHWIYLNMLMIQIVEIKNQELRGPHVVIEYVYYTNNF